MHLLIIILNHNRPELTIQSLKSLEEDIIDLRHRSKDTKVVVHDNGSSDDSAEVLQRAVDECGWRNWVILLRSDVNHGFAKGNNIAWEQAQQRNSSPTYILLLNNDTIVHKGSLMHCLNEMEDNPTIGILSCRLEHQDGSPQISARRFPTPLRMLLSAFGMPWKLPKLFSWADVVYRSREWSSPQEVDWVSGAFLMTRGEIIEKHGLLDADFFFYGEDIELCHRISRCRYRVVFDPRVSVVHLGGASTDEKTIEVPIDNPHRWQARYLVQSKCYGKSAARVIRCADLVAWTMSYCWNLIVARRKPEKREILRKGIGHIRRATIHAT